MSQTTKKGSSKKPAPMPQSQFVNYDLSKEQKEACKAWKFSLDEFATGLDRLVDDGYKISLSFDNYNKCFSAFLVPTGADHANAGMILSGRGSTVMKAFKQVCYKHYILLEENWQAVAGSRESDIDD